MHFELRPWQTGDVDDLVRAANNPLIARFMTDTFPHPYSRENGEKFLGWAIKDCPSKMFAIVVEGKAAGGIGIHPQADILRQNAEVGYWLSEQYWGKGIMTNAIRRIVPIAFETYPVSRLYGRVFGTNIPSQKAIEKAGFRLEAKFEQTIFKNGEYIDELIYACRREA